VSSSFVLTGQSAQGKAELVKAGVKEGFCNRSGGELWDQAHRDHQGSVWVIGEYWYTNLKEAVDFLDDAVAVNGMFFFFFLMPMA
jgi:hypothetical protein